MKNILFRKLSWKNSLPVITLICFGALLRLALLSKNDFWYDEAVTIAQIRNQFYHVTLPFYLLFMTFWTKLTGFSEEMLRLPSALFSTGSLAIAYNLSKKLFDKNTALISLMIMAINPFHLWYAQEARSYSLAVLLGLTSSYFLYLHLRKNQKYHFWLYCIFASLAIYTNYFCLIFIMAQIIYVVIFTNKLFKEKILFFLPFILFMPWSSFFITKFLFVKRGFWLPAPNLQSLAITLKNFIIGYNGTMVLYHLSSVFILILFFALILSLASRKNPKRKELIFCAISVFLPLLGAYVFSKCFFPIYLDRGFLIISPYFYILFAYVLNSMPNRMIKSILFTVLVVMCVVSDVRYFHNQMYLPEEVKYHVGVYLKKPFKPMLEFILKSRSDASCVIVANHSIEPMKYYLKHIKQTQGIDIPYYLCIDPNAPSDIWIKPYGKSRYTSKEILPRIIDDYTRIFFIAGDWPRDGTWRGNTTSIKNFFDQNLQCRKKLNFSGLTLFIYEQKT